MSKNQTTTSTIHTIPIHFEHIEMDVKILKLSADVPNFKEDSDPTRDCEGNVRSAVIKAAQLP
jgi:hypothetical protein